MRQILNRLLRQQPILWYLGSAVCIGLFIGWAFTPLSPAQAQLAQPIISSDIVLPAAQVHPLPTSLSQRYDNNQDDYFNAVQPTPVGYLIWSKFPVQVYVQPPDLSDPTGRSHTWYEAVDRALQEWTVYLPLKLASTAETADITIWRSAPPLQPLPTESNNQSPIDRLPRARSAETRYEIAVRRSPNAAAILSHRFTINLSPSQTEHYTQATARHELGHALGIWGHSSLQTDALYFSQVRNSPLISQRDVNTLKRVYEQPTRLGWSLPQE